jgi:drug/metabolite transporter (DMT)-like permease
MGIKVSPIVAHLVTAIIGIIALVVINIWGNENPTLTMILGGAVSGGIWGAYQRQKDPVEDSKVIPPETSKGELK